MNGKLTKALFINSQGFFSSSATASRASVHVDLDIIAASGSKVPSTISVKVLEIGYVSHWEIHNILIF